MEYNERLSTLNPLFRQRESKMILQRRINRKKELEEARKELERVEKEELRQQSLNKAKERRDLVLSPKKCKERRSWVLGRGLPPNQDKNEQTKPKERSKAKPVSLRSPVTESSVKRKTLTSSTRTRKDSTTNSKHRIYHSSQFRVSNLVPNHTSPVKLTSAKEATVSVKAEILPKEALKHEEDVHLERNCHICRICQSDEDTLANQLVTPCACTGSLRFVHHSCLQQWRKTKKASNADITKCELCLTQYDTQLLGKTDVKPDQTKKMQEDLRRLVRSGVYLMLLVDFCRDSFETLLQERSEARSNNGSVPIDIRNANFPHPVNGVNSTVSQQEQIEDHESSEENEEYVSRVVLKQRSNRHERK